MIRKPAAALTVALVGSVLAVFGLRSESEARHPRQIDRLGPPGSDPESPAARLYVTRPVSGPAARLPGPTSEPIALLFQEDTRSRTPEPHPEGHGRRDFPDGLPIYVDPIGLQVAEQTMQ